MKKYTKQFFSSIVRFVPLVIDIGAKLAGAAGADAPVVFFGLVVS